MPKTQSRRGGMTVADLRQLLAACDGDEVLRVVYDPSAPKVALLAGTVTQYDLDLATAQDSSADPDGFDPYGYSLQHGRDGFGTVFLVVGDDDGQGAGDPRCWDERQTW